MKCIRSLILLALFLPLCGPLSAQTPDTNALLSGWLNAQTNIQTWTADFTQIRSLKALTQPLTTTGHVWFAAPNRFHWQLGNPPQTIAVREPDELLVIYPKLKRAERYPLNSADAGQFKDTLALLDAGFPRNRADVESRFNLLSQRIVDGADELTLQPKSESARRFMPLIKIGFDTNSFALRSTELQFQDGSTMQNVFTNAQLNPQIDEKLFTPDIEGYKIAEPFKK
jgi:outer membrane lipoprotein-sorting protein